MKKADTNTGVSPSNQRKKLVLLDTHAILHRAYHALPDFASSAGEPTGALYGLSLMLMNIIEKLNPDYISACFDLPQPTHRHEVYKEYKAGRKKADPELISQIKRSRDIFKAWGIQEFDKPGYEADDILGTIVEQAVPKYPDVDILIASGDMDTLQLIQGERVRVYTLKKGIKDTIIYDGKAVKERFGFGPLLLPDYKGLRGDPSDNIIGIKGIGEKTAGDLINNFGTIEDIYKALKKGEKNNYADFEKAGIKARIIELLKNGEDEALFSKTLATIRRDAPIEYSLPEKNWRENVDLVAVENLFKELEFRSLIDKVKRFVAGTVVKKGEGAVVDSGVTPKEEASEVESLINADNAGEWKKLAIGAWLINSNITDPKPEDVLRVAHAKDLESAKKNISEEIIKRGLTRVYNEIELPLIPVLEKMKITGVMLDTDYLKKLSLEYHSELERLEGEIFALAGIKFNISSPKQLGEILFDKMNLVLTGGGRLKKTAGGARSTKESELQKLKDTHPIIAKILDHRELSKLVNTYIDTLPELLGEDRRIHADFIQTGTTTGRMSSANPNLQNIPIKSDLGRRIRDAFIAPEGYKIVAFDYSQIEIRVAAFLSDDKKLIEIFKNGRDVHTEVAAEVFGVPAEKVDKEMRRKAKVINFGVMYGMGVNALRANLGGDRKEAQEFYNNYFEKFSGLATYLNNVKSETARRGYAETFFGRRRYFEGINSKLPFIRAMAERMAINAPIQGTEADIVKLAMIAIQKWIDEAGLNKDIRMLMQVHDELVFEIKEGAVEKFAPEIQRIMENIIPPEQIKGIVCKSEWSSGSNWGDCK